MIKYLNLFSLKLSKMLRGFLFITLSSDRRLTYVKPRIGINKFGGCKIGEIKTLNAKLFLIKLQKTEDARRTGTSTKRS